jgi:epoxide hydrolase-like predicted phosphatase
MIKNIVFDLGNVLISYKPSEYLTKMGYPDEEKNIILNDIFLAKEWFLLDNGDLTTGEAIEKISERSSLNKAGIASFFDLRTDILYPIARNTKILPALKKRGFKLYYLSNFPEDIFDEVYNKYDFFKYFDGGIISARVRASKPDKKIFEILLSKYSISSVDCLFIDDYFPNIKTAESIGMLVLHIQNQENLTDQIEKVLGPVF